MSRKETFATPWRALADKWEKHYLPPGRPSRQDQAQYATYIKRTFRGKSGKALVLGATPEIRNVLHTFPIEVTVLDINLEMILGMNTFVPQAEQDILVRGSWVENPLRSNYYDVILGDFSWSNVPKKLWRTFNTTLVRLAKPNGRYIHRLHVVPDDWVVRPADEIVAKYGRLRYSKQRHFEMFFELLTNTYHPSDRTVSMSRVWDDVEKFWKDGRFRKGRNIPGGGILLHRLRAFWGTTEKEWQIGSPEQLRRDLAPYFTIIEESFSDDYLCNDVTPFWFCKVKN